MSLILAALDRLDSVSICQGVVADLMSPGEDGIDRDNLAQLLAFLQQEQRAAREQLAAALLPELAS